MYFDLNAIGRNVATARSSNGVPVSNLRSPAAIAQAALAAYASLAADPSSLVRLLRQLPQAPLPRPPQHSATLAQASAQLGDFLRNVDGQQIPSDFGYRQYVDLQEMRRLVDRKLAAQSQLTQALGNQVVASSRSALNAPVARIQPLRAPSAGQTTPTAPASTSQSTTPATTNDPVAPSTPSTPATPSAAADPTPASTPSTPTTPAVGPRAASDEFGSGLGAGMGHSSNLANSPEVVLALNNILGGADKSGARGLFGGFGSFGSFVDVNTLHDRLKNEYGIESTVTNINGQQALKFANGDVFMDTNGNGIIDGMDYNFGGAVDAIKAKYGFSDADLERFSSEAGRQELGQLSNARMTEELKRDDFQNIQDVAENMFGAAFGLAG